MGKKKYDITIHAGHNTQKKNGCGAVGILDESEFTRKVLKEVKKKLKKLPLKRLRKLRKNSYLRYIWSYKHGSRGCF